MLELPTTMSIGDQLRRLRKAAGQTQQQLANAAGMSLSAVAKLEQGETDPTWNTVRALAKALGVSVAEFDVPDEPAADPQPPSGGKPKRKGR